MKRSADVIHNGVKKKQMTPWVENSFGVVPHRSIQPVPRPINVTFPMRTHSVPSLPGNTQSAPRKSIGSNIDQSTCSQANAYIQKSGYQSSHDHGRGEILMNRSVRTAFQKPRVIHKHIIDASDEVSEEKAVAVTKKLKQVYSDVN